MHSLFSFNMECKKTHGMIDISVLQGFVFVCMYTGCFTTLGHNCRSDFLGLCDEKSSHKHVSDFGRLRSYDRLKLRIEGNDY